MTVVATTVANFSFGKGDEANLKLDARPGLYAGDLPLRLFPAVSGATVVATNGEISTNDVSREFSIPGEFVSFSGSDEASTEFPIEKSFSYESIGAEFDADGNEIEVTLSVENKRVKASVEFYGVFRVKYTTRYREYFWTYVKEGDSELLNLGQVIAFYNGGVASLTLSRSIVIQPHWVEYYKLTSRYVADAGDNSEETDPIHIGAWEYPPDFPSDPTYPTYPTSSGPDSGNHQVLNRVHMVGYINESGIQRQETFYQVNLQPFRSVGSYTPELTMSMASPPEGGNHDDAFSASNQQEAIDAVEREFPRHTINLPE